MKLLEHKARRFRRRKWRWRLMKLLLGRRATKRAISFVFFNFIATVWHDSYRHKTGSKQKHFHDNVGVQLADDFAIVRSC